MTAFRFSANTGFLWKELPFLDRIRRAAAHGFDAVEFHDEAQAADAAELGDVLAAAGLPVLGLNVRMGDTAGCAAVPGQEDQARRDIDAAIATARQVGAGAIHVLAGRTGNGGDGPAYLRALRHALDSCDLTILIEPISRVAMPDYFLHSLDQAARIIDETGDARLKIMFDCFHVEAEHGAVLDQFQKHADRIGHIQIASYPDRAEPDRGTIDYGAVLNAFRDSGYDAAFGCEYRPRSTVEAGLGWQERLNHPHRNDREFCS